MGGMKFGMNIESIALTAAALLLGPTVLNAAGGIFRSLVKAGVKSGLILYANGKVLATAAKERVESLAAEAKESIESISAEARDELHGETPKKTKKRAR